jgi:peptidoglycan/xylan/chitin deacetylase (PgdA/CDA1 family)
MSRDANRRAAPRRARRWGDALARIGIGVLGAIVAACAVPPPAAPEAPMARPRPAAAVTAVEPATGVVLARGERMLIYSPRVDETLRAIAARFLGAADDEWQIAEANGVNRAEAGQALIVPLKPLNPLGVQLEQVQTVPILCYHRFGGASGKMSVSASSFAQQLDWLARNDYHVIRLAQLVAFLDGQRPLPRRSVVITMDDGYESVHSVALPLLRKHGFAATVFVYPDFIGARDAMSWAQLQDLVASGLVDVQAHSKSHRNLIERASGETDERYRQNIEQEARAPREALERRLGAKVRHFAYPYGDANDTVLEVLARQQYQLGVTVNPGGNAFFAQPMMLRRTMIFGDYDLEAFKAKLQISRTIATP